MSLYLPEELARADGLRVPLYLDHEDFEMDPRTGKTTGHILPKKARGLLTLIWNKVMQRLEYAGEVWDGALQRLISSGQRPHVSLAAEPREFDEFRGHNVPINMQFFSVAAVKDPGIPESTITMEQRLGAYLESAAPAILESASKTVVLEFDTESLAEEDDARSLLRGNRRAAMWLAAEGAPEGMFGAPPATLSAPKELIARSGDFPLAPAAAKTPGAAPKMAEPMHADFAKMRSAMGKQYGDRADDVYYATVNKRGFDDTKPMPAEFAGWEDDMAALIPQGYSKLTPIRGASNARSGLPGVTGTGNMTPMQGTGANQPRGPLDPAFRPVLSPTAQDQQIMPRNLVDPALLPGAASRSMTPAGQPPNRPLSSARGQPLVPRSAVDNPAATPFGVGRESTANKGRGDEQGAVMPRATREEEEEEEGASSSSQSTGRADVSGAQTKVTKLAHDVQQKAIGAPSTPYERKDDEPGDDHSNPNAMPTIGPQAREEEGPRVKMPAGQGTGPEVDTASEEEEEVKEAGLYGFSREEYLDLKSVYTKSQWPNVWAGFKGVMVANPRLKEYIKRNRIEMSGVTRPPSIAQGRESRVGGADVVSTTGGRRLGVMHDIPNLNEHVLAVRGEGGRFLARSHIPLLFPPPISRSKGIAPRLEFMDELTDWSMEKQRLVSEAIATTTSGAAMAVDGAIPALIVPTNLAAMLRDTVYFQQIQQGSNTARFQTITVPAAGALTQNTEPSQATQTLATVDIVPTPRGVEQQISFEAERKILGPILEGVILSFRVSELYDEDFLLLGASQALEGGGFPTTGQLYGTGNQIFGAGRASESVILSTDTFTLATLTDAQEIITAQGYSPDNLVAVIHPAQFRKLLQDSNVNRLISFGPNTTAAQAWVAQGVIPELVGFEIRRSTLMVQGTGTSSITTYHGWAYKKGLTVAMAASRDLMVETFRDIRANATWVKGHWDLLAKVLHPNSEVLMDTA